MKPQPRTPLALPPLHNGDQLSQPEFHRRYQAYPEDVVFELVGGVVYMASPMNRPHGTTHLKLGLVVGLYEANTPGVEGADNMTTILGPKSEPQPDLMLRLLSECGGQSIYNDEDYLTGAPEFVAEVAHSTEAIDLGPKRKDYLSAGVQEYLVVCLREREIRWYHFPSRRQLHPDKSRIYRSCVFPGLWLNMPALFAHDAKSLIATAQEGIASAEHQRFAGQLRERLGTT